MGYGAARRDAALGAASAWDATSSGDGPPGDGISSVGNGHAARHGSTGATAVAAGTTASRNAAPRDAAAAAKHASPAFAGLSVVKSAFASCEW